MISMMQSAIDKWAAKLGIISLLALGKSTCKNCLMLTGLLTVKMVVKGGLKLHLSLK